MCHANYVTADSHHLNGSRIRPM